MVGCEDHVGAPGLTDVSEELDEFEADVPTRPMRQAHLVQTQRRGILNKNLPQKCFVSSVPYFSISAYFAFRFLYHDVACQRTTSRTFPVFLRNTFPMQCDFCRRRSLSGLIGTTKSTSQTIADY